MKEEGLCCCPWMKIFLKQQFDAHLGIYFFNLLLWKNHKWLIKQLWVFFKRQLDQEYLKLKQHKHSTIWYILIWYLHLYIQKNKTTKPFSSLLIIDSNLNQATFLRLSWLMLSNLVSSEGQCMYVQNQYCMKSWDRTHMNTIGNISDPLWLWINLWLLRTQNKSLLLTNDNYHI